MACNITVPALMANASVIDNLLRALRISDTSATIHLLNGLQGSPVADDPWAIVQLILDSIQRQPSPVAAAGATILTGDTGYLAPAPEGDAAPRPVEAHATRMCGGTAAAAVPAVSTLATQVIPPDDLPTGATSRLTLTVVDMPAILATVSGEAGHEECVYLHLDTGTSPNLISEQAADRLYSCLSQHDSSFDHQFLEQPLQFTTAGSGFCSTEYIVADIQIGAGLYPMLFFVVPNLTFDAILGMEAIASLGVRFNYAGSMVRLRLPRARLAPGCSQPANGKGETMTCQWVPMSCDISNHALY